MDNDGDHALCDSREVPLNGTEGAARARASVGPDKATGGHLDRARACWANGDAGQALSELTEAVLQNSADAEAFLLRGEIEASRGNPEQAVLDFTEALTIDLSRALE